ncbi:unnamed protein product [Spirodela intermedia]|uniref:Uncharacterized protein n=2 Tax=Spirodela intermedia TaxID=51605 RepID=A0A7I8LL91_SPIIN|nr:unnamed protein product [Spirodela intermedia]CAA6673412.1 unnamed protein product [Spirodela intermedia]CAA7410642.1 unnamed protein product [Spirodela intermedia]
MAVPSASAAIVFLAVFSLLAVGAVGRPCKTLFISYTFSSESADSSSQSGIEVSQISTAREQARTRFVTFYRVIPLRYYHSRSHLRPAAATELFATAIRLPAGIERPRPRFEPSLAVSSLRERTRDILVVVAALVFGVGCGALTSAMIYLAWYLISNRNEVCGFHDYDYDDDVEDGVESPKKRGYTDLPAAPATPVTPLKEGYGGN